MTASETPTPPREPGPTPAAACRLGSEDLATQVERWQRLARAAGRGRTETADGLRVRFHDDPAVEEELRALVAAERTCCAWASWQVSRADGELVLSVSATGLGIATLHTMFARAAP